jgi:predicted dehydrogenase
MIKLAVIGTNWITDNFIQGALQTGKFELCAVYSRSLEQAKNFGLKYNVKYFFDDLEIFASSTEFEAVYIASPNSFHNYQSIRMLKSSKHVICEKPLASDYTAAKDMYKTAEENDVVLFEAFMTPFLPNFAVLKENIKDIGSLRKVMFSYCQYSSRYPKFLRGENPNTFNPSFSNGSVMDIGYYCLGAAIELFGEPKSVYATAHILESGVDGNGSIILGYNGFDAVLMHSKTSNSFLPSEIQGEQACLQIEMISTCNKVSRIDRNGHITDLSVGQKENRMFYEANAFADQVIINKIDTKSKTRSLTLAKVLTEVRIQTGVIFPTDP